MLNYKTVGSGRHLVLIHGFGFCGEVFAPLIKKYQYTYQITTIDLPGHGKSDSIADFDDWIAEIAKIIPYNATILGWSLGGLVAIQLAQIIKVKKVILCASSPKFVSGNNWEFGIDKINFQSFSKNLNLNIGKGLIRFISLQGVEKNIVTSLKEIIQNNPPSVSGLNTALDILLNTDLREEILTIGAIEVVLGETDTIVPKAIAYWYQKHNINTKILSGGHLPFLHPEFKLG